MHLNSLTIAITISLTVSSLLSVQALEQQSANANETLFETPVIENLQDIEALSYFILARRSRLGLRTEDGVVPLNATLDDQNFKDFLLKLKEGSFFRDEETAPSCDVLVSQYHEVLLWQKSIVPNDQLDRKLTVLCETARKCHSAHEFVSLISGSIQKNDVTLNQAIVRLCPLILSETYQKGCLASDDSTYEKHRPTSGAVWGFGFLFVTIISFCSIIGVVLMPFLDQKSFLIVLNICEGLGVGSLVGSAIFHLIPQSFNLLAQDVHHEYLWKALIIFGGIYLFYWSERIMKIVVDYRRKQKIKEMALPSVTEVSHEANGGIGENDRHVSFNEDPKANGGTYPESGGNHLIDRNCDYSKIDNGQAEQHLLVSNKENGKIRAPDHFSSHDNIDSLSKRYVAHAQGHSHGNGGLENIATVAWMIIFGDALHNFIDGLSIGAAFSESTLAGISISVAVICEEFPHELGDFAILIASGMSIRQAIGYNFLSACTCYLGMVIGILVGDFTEGSTYILALAGGMFLYIALVDMMNELSSTLEEAMRESVSKAINVLLLQNLGILTGICALFLLAKYSGLINFEGLMPIEDHQNLITSS